ncbi:MAG TPA: M48 family metalloprotease [Terriglobia bacterium]|nr:M48 family metalloprotease [Terriglobia bacterium]
MRNIRLCGCLLAVAVAVEPARGSPAQGVADEQSRQESFQAQSADQTPAGAQASYVLDRIIAQENNLVRSLVNYRPRVETYIQDFRLDPALGTVPAGDHYYLGALDFRGGLKEQSLLPGPRGGRRALAGMATEISRLYGLHFQPQAFAYTIVMDVGRFDLQHYGFTLVRREFLGSVRCLVFDVVPRQHAGTGLFKGRLWVEDQDYHIVRFNGTYATHPKFEYYFHFDSWRQNLQPGLWLPVYVYTEETKLKYNVLRSASFKAQTRLWGYDLASARHQQTLTWVVVDAPAKVDDTSPAAQPPSPIEGQRAWQRQAEENVLDRLEGAGLLAPPGDVDQVCATVVNNLVVTSQLDTLPAIHCRVLLTVPLESLAIGYTIVVSRGLIDVLPDEASLAMELAHELAHIALGHTQNEFDTRFAFYDRTLVPDDQLLRVLDFHRTSQEEEAADRKSVELLRSSPYRDKLASAGLFLKALSATSVHTPRLLGPHLGDRLAQSSRFGNLADLMNIAPQLQPARLDQLAALPLGARILLDSWSGRVSLVKPVAIALISPREKKPFEITPLFPFLTRLPSPATDPNRN